jgi:hypothetical protein
MAETIGLAIVEAIALTGEAEGLVAFAEGSIIGISGATAIGTTTILAVSIGLSYALRPGVPKAEAGALQVKQSISPRQRGYWNCRLAGCIMLAQASSTTTYEVGAFHHGLVEDVIAVYFDDDAVGVAGDFKHGVAGAVGGPGGIYGNASFGVVLGTETQTASASLISDPGISGTWTSAFRGRGVAYWFLVAASAANPTLHQMMYPRGLPKPSVVARCSPIWDPRSGAQSRFDSSTWVASPNPVLQLIDYLTRVDGGMGLDLDDILPPAQLAAWMVEASLCDVDLGAGNIRYRSAGFYTFDNKPEDVKTGSWRPAMAGWRTPATARCR